VVVNVSASGLKRALAKYKPDLLIYTGHGAQIVNRRQNTVHEALVCPGFCPGAYTFVSDSDLMILRQQAGIDMIIDACHAGGLYDGETAHTARNRGNRHSRTLGSFDVIPRSILSARTMRDIRRERTGRLVAASTKQESAYEGVYYGELGGLFTLSVKHAKAGVPLGPYVEEQVALLSKGRQHPNCTALEEVLNGADS
jgi:hypothetical protein